MPRLDPFWHACCDCGWKTEVQTDAYACVAEAEMHLARLHRDEPLDIVITRVMRPEQERRMSGERRRAV